MLIVNRKTKAKTKIMMKIYSREKLGDALSVVVDGVSEVVVGGVSDVDVGGLSEVVGSFGVNAVDFSSDK